MGQRPSKPPKDTPPKFQVGEVIPAARHLWFGRAAYTNEGKVVKTKWSEKEESWMYKLDGNLRWMRESELTELELGEGDGDG
ncbi:hypothetical protein Vi05172_g11496 [Venturia inaequalis]|nr:hypothetical protein Vi05172_g11496 [Venturia inaequalis]